MMYPFWIRYRFWIIFSCTQLVKTSMPACFNFIRNVGLDNRKPKGNFTELFSTSNLGHCINSCAADAQCMSLFYNFDSAKCGTVKTFLSGNESVRENAGTSICFERLTSCNEGWRGFQGKCYLFSKEEANFSTAKAFCEEKGAYLVELVSSSVEAFVRENMNTEGIEKVWTGASRAENGIWSWAYSDQPFVYVNWDTSEPNGDGLVMEYFGKWNDIGDYAKRSVTCETVGMTVT